ncbi:MAG: penicillin-binding protein 2, partial [Pseudomonadales bacterium]|nr:penicillin-binding protein 2 [Pseudomonadales bacterium]
SFDANLFVQGISFKDYAALRDSWKIPLFNRVVQGQYPPGSTLKPIMGLAGLESGVIGEFETVEDPGYFQLPNEEHKYRDWKKGGHGSGVNLKKAIAESCDTYFFEMSYRLGIDRLSPFLGEFGLGQPTGVDFSSERSGLLPSREWKRAVRGLPWFPGDTLNMGIGQGDMLATPIQLAYATSIVASKGKRVKPRVVKKIDGQPTSIRREPDLILQNAHYWDVVQKAMEEVTHGARGTARRSASDLEYRMAGKTGTAQVVGIKQGEEYDPEQLATIHLDHALFVGYAPADKPEIAVAVVIENGQHGSSTAAPMARALFDAYLLRADN